MTTKGALINQEPGPYVVQINEYERRDILAGSAGRHHIHPSEESAPACFMFENVSNLASSEC